MIYSAFYKYNTFFFSLHLSSDKISSYNFVDHIVVLDPREYTKYFSLKNLKIFLCENNTYITQKKSRQIYTLPAFSNALNIGSVK